ncbi:MAG: hypothetical protein AB3N21_12985 [Ruegeria sp.]|uniref:hypothetical protein n=1 Tax=Ruegeria sp. TaxID=1879320 RepID=UPI00349E6AB4
MTALDLCSGGMESLQTARATLESVGWAPWEEGPASILASNAIAFSVDATNPAHTVDNALFMAVSILGNSELGANQPAFVLSDIRLALVGVEEGKPYCAFAGPDWLVHSALRNGANDGLQAKTELVTLMLGEHGNAMFAMSLVDVDAFVEVLSKAEAEDTDRKDMGPHLRELLAPANIQVVPKSLNAAEEVQQ